MPILDSGSRREFDSGAVRDCADGRGRCDLMPLDVVASFMTAPHQREIMEHFEDFKQSGDENNLIHILNLYISHHIQIEHDGYMLYRLTTMLLEVAKHFEEGCKKYGENNWQKGIPTHCYVDSAVRHYLKYLRGDNDEPHDRAFCWNILCCIWTCIHKPELNDYKKGDTNVQ